MIAVALLALALYIPGTLYPPSDVSHTVFRVAVCLAATTVAWPKSRLARWGLGLWAIGIAASVVLAGDPWRAVWSTHGRNEGAWQVGHYLVLTLAAAAYAKDKLPRWVAVSALMAVAWGLTPLGWAGDRLVGSAGNPLYLAPLLIVGIWGAYRASRTSFRVMAAALDSGSPIPSGVMPRREAEEHVSPGTIWRALAVVLALAAVATGSKGVGVAAVAAFGVLAMARFPRLFYAGAVALAAGLWFVPIANSNVLIRLELGRVAAHGIAAQPWGWGAEGFPYVWDTFWRGAAPTGENWHDRAHSLVLDRAIEWGVVGVAGWLMVIAAAWRRAELPERMAIAAYLGFGLTMFEMMWGAAGFAVLLGYTLQGRPCRVDKRIAWTAAAVALGVGALGLAQSRAAYRAATMPAMQAAVERWSPIGGDVIELYLKAPQTHATLAWADDYVEWRSPHATQQAFLLAAWGQWYCGDLRMVAPLRPDVKMLCRVTCTAPDGTVTDLGAEWHTPEGHLICTETNTWTVVEDNP